jgi:hypothetical protein
MINAKYFKEYRELLGFSNQNNVKAFFGAKDIIPAFDYNYVETLNIRICDIIKRINDIVHDSIKVDDILLFLENRLTNVFKTLKNNDILLKLNNQGRRPEEVYFSWMRGFVVSAYFLKSIGTVFGVNKDKITTIGDDDFLNIETFKRTPKADLEIELFNNKKIRIEVQSGFQGINDIKQHKVLESRKVKDISGILSIVIHFDLFNGQVAFVRIDDIEDDNINWITRQQMEGQTVFNIDQNYFCWKITDVPPKIQNILSI